MRTLHVAAMPFPTQQGTQALVHVMLTELARAGHDTHLLCYPHAGFARESAYTLHRSLDLARDHSERSGPSVRKVVQDVQLARDLRSLHAKLRPARVICHHVEATVAAHLARLPAVTFVAHTSLAAELPSYFSPVLDAACEQLGRLLDRAAASRAARHLAISPLLQERLSQDTSHAFALLTPPWRPHAPLAPEEQSQARTRFELASADKVALYAGNLDAYQGLEVLCAGLEHAHQRCPRLRLLVGTESDPAQLLAALSAPLRKRTRCVRLTSDAVRRALHAASDVALVPRRSPGGLPIKLLDALAHGLPVLAAERAAAGFAFGPACRLVPDDDVHAWSRGLVGMFDLSAEHRRAFAQAAREVLERAHGPEACVAQLLA